MKQLKKSADCIFTDLNLRAAHYSQETIDEALLDADWVKVNEEEFSECFQMDSTVENALRVISATKISHLLVTRGPRGAFYADETEKVVEANYQSPSNLKDTVGAGDGFSAAMIAAILDGTDIQSAIDFACRFAGMLCEIRGATSNDSGFYRRAVKLRAPPVN